MLARLANMRPLVAAALVVLFLFAMWLAFRRGATQRTVSVGFTTTNGHFPEPVLVVGDQIITAWVTNTGRSAITLNEPYVLFENAAGGLVRDQGASWNQKGYSADLPPGTAAWLANGFDRDRKRLRFIFEYHRDGGPLLRIISKVVGMLPLRQLPQRAYDWLHRNGIVDGIVYGHYESSWIANPGWSDGRQPIRSEKYRAPAAAASRRSP